MPIVVRDTSIRDVKIIEPRVFEDDRGFFMESWNHRDFTEKVGEVTFVQDNHSKSRRGVLRGMHFQLPPYAQAKLVRCIVGNIFDVAVDIRRSSATFGQWVGVELSADNKRQLWIPEGFAHGFLTLSDTAEVFYKTNNFWNKNSEGAIRWCDSQVNIRWPVGIVPFLSPKDAFAPLFTEAQLFD